MIWFNKPYFTGKEIEYIKEAIDAGQLSGNRRFTKLCQSFFEKKYGFAKTLLTTSCTDALEMCALLLNITTNDEVIMPAYTFVSTANAFVLRGAKIVFADSQINHPNIDATKIEALITPNTKAIVVVHYAGVACDMEAIMAIANKYGLFVVEDAAQAIDAQFKNYYLGGIGHLSAFSFHETKNLSSGEGGMLVINDEQFAKRAEILWEKGTNRSAFHRGEVDKYTWVDMGSSFLPADIIAAFLYAQLENLRAIQQKRLAIWQQYYNGLLPQAQKKLFTLPTLPQYASNNAHMFYLVCNNLQQRTELITALRQKGIMAVFHYLSLHESPFYQHKHDGRALPNCNRFDNCLVRLPLFYELTSSQVQMVIDAVADCASKWS